jgi:hypothetical protein
MLSSLLLSGAAPAGNQAQMTPDWPAASWTPPAFVTDYGLTHPDIDATGAHMVAVNWSSDNRADNAKYIMYSTFTGGVWGAPSILADNAVYTTGMVQDPPRHAFPVISADGETIAYLGYNAVDNYYGLYIIDKTGLVWGTPYSPSSVDRGLDDDLEISGDGDTITYSNSASWLGTMKVYVTRRVGGVWQPQVTVSSAGAQASISADGKKIVYQNNYTIEYAEYLSNGSWSTPLNLTHGYFPGYLYYFYLPKISPDGNAIFFWRYQLEPGGGGNVVTGKDLYTMRRFGNTWSRPVKINGDSIVPDLTTESRAAVNQSGTRVAFSRLIWGNPFTGSQLELTEFSGGVWSQPVVLTVPWQADYARLAPDGKTAIFEHTNNSNGGIASISTTDNPPGYAYTTANALIHTTGGSLFSSLDETTITFGNGSFAQDSQAIYTLVPGESLPVTGNLAGIGRGFDLSAINATTGMPVQVDQDHPFSITVNYAGQHGAAIESTLQLFAWHPDTFEWEPITSTLNITNKTVSTNFADFLTLYAVMGEPHSVFLPVLTK